MTDQKLKDQSLSHRILNYLNAVYQGRFAWFNVLAQFGHPDLDNGAVDQTKNALSAAADWMDRLYNGETLFEEQRGQRQKEEADKAFALLQPLQSELTGLADKVKEALAAGDLPNQHQRTIFLIAAFCRLAYGMENYAQGFVDFGTSFNKSDMVAAWKAKLTDAADKISLANDFVAIFKDPSDMPPNFFQHLAYFCRLLPGTFRSQAHDIAQILHTFKGNFTYERAGFLKPDGAVWDRAEISPVEAGYWRSHDFTKDGALEWRKLGLDSFAAAEWSLAGFSAEQAMAWLQIGFSPLLALQWLVAKYTPEEAGILVARGHPHPGELTREQAEQIIAAGPPQEPKPAGPPQPNPTLPPKGGGPPRLKPSVKSGGKPNPPPPPKKPW